MEGPRLYLGKLPKRWERYAFSDPRSFITVINDGPSHKGTNLPVGLTLGPPVMGEDGQIVDWMHWRSPPGLSDLACFMRGAGHEDRQGRLPEDEGWLPPQLDPASKQFLGPEWASAHGEAVLAEYAELRAAWRRAKLRVVQGAGAAGRARTKTLAA